MTSCRIEQGSGLTPKSKEKESPSLTLSFCSQGDESSKRKRQHPPLTLSVQSQGDGLRQKRARPQTEAARMSQTKAGSCNTERPQSKP